MKQEIVEETKATNNIEPKVDDPVLVDADVKDQELEEIKKQINDQE